jgi:hypothetical protein
VQRQSAAELSILNLSLAAGDEDLDAPTTYAWDEAIPRLEEVEGVARVVLVGGADERIETNLYPLRSFVSTTCRPKPIHAPRPYVVGEIFLMPL